MDFCHSDNYITNDLYFGWLLIESLPPGKARNISVTWHPPHHHPSDWCKVKATECQVLTRRLQARRQTPLPAGLGVCWLFQGPTPYPSFLLTAARLTVEKDKAALQMQPAVGEAHPFLIISHPLSGLVMKGLRFLWPWRGCSKGSSSLPQDLDMQRQQGSEWAELYQETTVLMSTLTMTLGEVPPHLQFPHLPREEGYKRRLLTSLTWGSKKCERGQHKEFLQTSEDTWFHPKGMNISFWNMVLW